MSKAPAFQFYAADFLVGVAGMSNEEVGVYIKLLAFQWERGSLPPDDKDLRNLVGSRKPISAVTLAKFPKCEDGQLRNGRLEKERQKQADFRDSRARAAQKRWSDISTSNARASEMQSTSNALLSSSSSSEKNTHTAHGTDESELLPKPQAIAQATNVGIPEDFAVMVYSEWEEKQGRYRDGIIPFIRRVKGRWDREQLQWKSGTHSGQRGKPSNGTYSKSSGRSGANDNNANAGAASDYPG